MDCLPRDWRGCMTPMILIEECRLRLDDPIDALLPELANRGVLRTLDS